MKKTLRTLKDILEEQALLVRFGYTLLLTFIFRIGAKIPLPGISPTIINAHKDADSWMGFMDSMLGGALSNYSLFSLGIYPYISASIVIQVFTLNHPYFRRLKTQEGAAGRMKLTLHTRQFAFGISFFKALALLKNLLGSLQTGEKITITTWQFYFLGLVVLVTGTMISIWIADQITEKGVGNGSSILISSGILANLPTAIGDFRDQSVEQKGPLLFAALLFISLGVLIYLVINFTQGIRRVVLQRAQALQNPALRLLSNRRQYLPLKLNGAGVMPIIMATMVSSVPGMIAQWLCSDFSKKYIFRLSQEEHSSPALEFLKKIKELLSQKLGLHYNMLLFVLIFFTTYLWTAMFVSTTDMSSDLKQRNSFIPGVRPGPATARYIDDILLKIVFPSSLFLAMIAIMPGLAHYLGVGKQFAPFCGGTSLIITIGTLIEVVQQANTYLFNKRYSQLINSQTANHRLDH